MSVETQDRVKNILERMGFTFARKIFSRQYGTTAASETSLIEKVVGLCERNPRLITDLDLLWENFILGGKRLVHSLRVNEEQMNKALTAIHASKESQDKNPLLLSCLPYPLDDSHFGTHTDGFFIADVKQHDLSIRHNTVTVAIICSVASYTKTEELSEDKLNDEGKQLLENAESISIRSRKKTQCFNLIIFDPENSTITLAVDMSELPQKDAVFQNSKLLGHLKKTLKLEEELRRPINLFPAISPMYDNSSGYVSKLAFLTADGNPSYLSARQQNKRCLKKDTYHKGGEENAGTLTKYRIGKTWDRKQELYEDLFSEPEIELPGQRNMLEGSGGRLFYATTKGCMNLEDTLFVIDKALAALPIDPSKD